jgi:hypothetical protein
METGVRIRAAEVPGPITFTVDYQYCTYHEYEKKEYGTEVSSKNVFSHL